MLKLNIIELEIKILINQIKNRKINENMYIYNIQIYYK